MSAGLPALGLGGMFYMLLIVWMVLREVVRKPTGDASHPSRWPFIGKMVVIGLLMVLAAFAEALFIRGALDLDCGIHSWLGKIRVHDVNFIRALYAHNPVYSPPSAHSGCAFLTPVDEPAAEARS